jgi:predicted RNA-binding protein associated with RNAse of E/G family
MVEGPVGSTSPCCIAMSKAGVHRRQPRRCQRRLIAVTLREPGSRRSNGIPRNGGSEIVTETRRLRDRNGLWYALDRLSVGRSGLYHARATPEVELFTYHERWLLPGPGWAISRFVWRPNRPGRIDWYIEPEIIEVDGSVWRVRDGYLDLAVHEGLRYQLEDADELAEAIAAGEIPLTEALAALTSLQRLCTALRGNGCSGQALLAEFAPELPQ